jgi:hypothetical protein
VTKSDQCVTLHNGTIFQFRPHNIWPEHYSCRILPQNVHYFAQMRVKSIYILYAVVLLKKVIIVR